MNASYCTAAVLEELKISENWLQLTIQIVSTIMCIMALPLTYWACKRFEQGRLVAQVKILMYFHHEGLAIYAVSYVVTQSYHLYLRFFYNDCELLVPVPVCFFFRIPQSFASVFFQAFYVGVVLDAICKFGKCWTENCTRFLGWGVVIFSAFVVGGSLFVDLESKEYMLNCSSFEHKTLAVQKVIFRNFLYIDAFSFIAFGGLHLAQKRIKKNPRTNLNIPRRSNAKLLDRTKILILPNLCLNLVCYVYFSVVSYWAATEEKLNGNSFLWANSVPIYVCLSPVIFILTLKKANRKVTPVKQSLVDEYFDNLNRVWHDTHFFRQIRNSAPDNKRKETNKKKRSTTQTSSFIDLNMETITTA